MHKALTRPILLQNEYFYFCYFKTVLIILKLFYLSKALSAVLVLVVECFFSAALKMMRPVALTGRPAFKLTLNAHLHSAV